MLVEGYFEMEIVIVFEGTENGSSQNRVWKFINGRHEIAAV